jgi:histidinol dehydrogenase
VKDKQEEAVKKIIEDVRRNGDKALMKYCAKFDKNYFAKASQLKVSDLGCFKVGRQGVSSVFAQSHKEYQVLPRKTKAGSVV